MQSAGPFAGRAPVNFTGVESQAAAADAIFGSNGSNTWNYLTVPAAGHGPTINPSFSSLVDSNNVATTVGIAFAGSVRAANDTPIDNAGSDGVENDYFFIFANTVSYEISGLAANARYAFYVYSPKFTHFGSGDPTGRPSRGFTLTTNVDPIDVPSGFGTENALAFVTSSTSGDISGTWSTAGNEGDWSGFQLAAVPTTSVPEPASLMLLGSGLIGVVGLRHSRRR